TVVGTGVVVVQVHVPGLPAVAVVDGDVPTGRSAISDPEDDTVGRGVHLGVLGSHQIVALVAVTGAGRAPAARELGHLGLLGECQVEVGGRRQGTGDREDSDRDRGDTRDKRFPNHGELQGTGTGGIDPVVWNRKDPRPLVILFTNSERSMGRWSWSPRNDFEGPKP